VKCGEATDDEAQGKVATVRVQSLERCPPDDDDHMLTAQPSIDTLCPFQLCSSFCLWVMRYSSVHAI
jgi:hypothetical protein